MILKKILLAAIALTALSPCRAQTSETKYFNNVYVGNEVPADRAKYSRTITQNPDGSVTTEINDIRKSKLVSRETVKGEEPFGIWKYDPRSGKNELDYSFNLVYADPACRDSINGIKDYFENNDSLKYTAPVVSTGEKSALEFIARRIFYPALARENGIMGKVYFNFVVTEQGLIEGIVVTKGVHIVLDKEAARVLRELKFSAPAMLEGKPKRICVTMPVNFKLM